MGRQIIELARETIAEFDAYSGAGAEMSSDSVEKRNLACYVLELWDHLDGFESQITHSEDADATVNSIVEKINKLRDAD